MKKVLLLILLSISSYLFTVDLKTYFLMDNFHFNANDKLLSTDYHFEFGQIVTQDISDGLFLDIGFTKSIISDYSIYTDIRLSNDFFGFNLGIFTNFLNDSSKILTPGLNYGLDVVIPGIMLLNLDLNNTIPNTSPLESGVSINNYAIMLGFYLGEAIISGNLSSENNSKGTILNSKTTINNKYYLNVDLFNKYSSYRISIDLGWNSLSRKVTSLSTESNILVGNTDKDLEAGSAFFNTKFTILAIDNVVIDLGFLLHLIKFPLKNVVIDSNEFNWGLNLGFQIKL